MKKIILLITTVLLCLLIKAQDIPDDNDGNIAIEAPESEPYIDLGDPKYKSFFSSSPSSSLSFTLKSEIIHINPSIIKYNQTDSRWANNPIATSCNTCINSSGNPYGIIVNGSKTSRCGIGSIGCALTCQSMVLATFGYNQDPGTWNTYSTANNCFSGCLLDFTRNGIYQYSHNISSSSYVSKQNIVKYSGSSDDVNVAKILKYVIDKGGVAIVKINRLGKQGGIVITRPTHFVLIYGYKTDNPTLRDFILSDPGTSYDDDKLRTLGDYYDPALNGKSPLFVSTQERPTIRFYMKHQTSGDVLPSHLINLQNTNFITSQILGLDIWFPGIELKSASDNIAVLWTITAPNGQVTTSTNSSFEYTLYKPGTYTITLLINDASGFYTDTKTITVTGDPIVTLGDCHKNSLGTILTNLYVTKTTISSNYGDWADNTPNSCNWKCFTFATKIEGPNFSDRSYGTEIKYSYLSPNTHYKIMFGSYSCDEFWSCGYNFYYGNCAVSCYLNVITTPLVINENDDISGNGSCYDLAFNSIELKPGFRYKPSNNSNIYSAKIATGKQVWLGMACDTKSADKDDITEPVFSAGSGNKNKILIYPNPTNSIVNIEILGDINGTFKIEFINSTGKVVKIDNLMNGMNEINIEDCPAGLYILKIHNNNTIFTKKLLKN